MNRTLILSGAVLTVLALMLLPGVPFAQGQGNGNGKGAIVCGMDLRLDDRVIKELPEKELEKLPKGTVLQVSLDPLVLAHVQPGIKGISVRDAHGAGDYTQLTGKEALGSGRLVVFGEAQGFDGKLIPSYTLELRLVNGPLQGVTLYISAISRHGKVTGSWSDTEKKEKRGSLVGETDCDPGPIKP